jgi:hypothetical protein
MIPLQQRTASVAARKYERIYYSVLSFLNKVWQSKVHPRTGHEDPEGGGQIYSCTLPSTSALDGVGGQRHARAALPPGKDPVPVV